MNHKTIAGLVALAALLPMAARAELATVGEDGFYRATAVKKTIETPRQDGRLFEAAVGTQLRSTEESYRDGTTVDHDEIVATLKLSARLAAGRFEFRPWGLAAIGRAEAELTTGEGDDSSAKSDSLGLAAGTTAGYRLNPYGAYSIEPLLIGEYSHYFYDYGQNANLAVSERSAFLLGGGMRADWRPTGRFFDEVWLQGVALLPVASKTVYDNDLGSTSQNSYDRPEIRLEVGAAAAGWTLQLAGSSYTSNWNGGKADVTNYGLAIGRRF